MSQFYVALAPRSALGLLLALLWRALAVSLAQAVVIFALLAPAAARAQVETETPTPGLWLATESGVSGGVLQSSTVEIAIAGPLAQTKMQQRFRNAGSEWAEGIYVLPMPASAALRSLVLTVDGREIRGIVKERQRAQETYTAAAAAGKQAGLVTQERPNVFTVSVANIPPGEVIDVELAYQHRVEFDAGRHALRVPLVVAPRYTPGQALPGPASGSGWSPDTDQVPDAARVTSPVVPPGADPVNPTKLRVFLEADGAINWLHSPSHSVSIEQQAPRRAEVALTAGEAPADRDFVLHWVLAPDARPRAAIYRYAPAPEDELPPGEYGLFSLQPPALPASARLSRSVTLVLDRSGSMAGASIRQARTAVTTFLDDLGSDDHFNLRRFNNLEEGLFGSPQPATADNLRLARRWVRNTDASGGTEMHAALEASLGEAVDETRVRQVIFITDGAVSNETALFDLINRRLGAARLFTIGIGSAPNGHFMRRAAELGRGSHLFISNAAEVAAELITLLRKLSAPAVTELEVDWSAGNSIEQWPRQLPDLFLGEPLHFVARGDKLPRAVTIRGRLQGQDWSAELAPTATAAGEAIAVQWARAKLGHLANQPHQAVAGDAVYDELLRTALAYQLVSRYTALVAVHDEPRRPAQQPLKARAVPVNLPVGWRHQSVFGSDLPQTATPAALWMLTGLGSILSGALAWRQRRHGV